MIVTAKTVKALCIMYAVHRNQRDKAKAPYWLHPLRVADGMKDEDTATVALLHDVVEDYGKCTPQWDGFSEMVRHLACVKPLLALQVASFLFNNGRPISDEELEKIINVGDKDLLFERLCEEGVLLPKEEEALALLTRDKSIPYGDYIRNVSTSFIATIVKLADLKDNCNFLRLPKKERKTKKVLSRCKKYRAAAIYLRCSLGMDNGLEVIKKRKLIKRM